MTYPFAFKVLGYLSDGDDSYYYEQCGVSLCSGYADAAQILEKTYGDELITIKHLELFEDSPVIYMPKDMVNSLVKNYIHGCESTEEVVSNKNINNI